MAVSLLSMLALGALAHSSASNLLTKKTRRQLDSLAESKKEDLENVISSWRDRVSLIASRTQLRISLSEYNETGNSEHLDTIERILTDARSASQSLLSLSVYDIGGRPVAADGLIPEAESANLMPPRAAGDTIVFQHIYFANAAEPRASFIAALVLNGESIGALRVVLKAQELIDVTRNFIGLGETGETMIVLQDSAGVTQVLHPVRQRANERSGLAQLGGANSPATLAIQGRDTVITEGLIDYRGEVVWAATRHLEDVGWGVVVKFDEDEERAEIAESRRDLAQTGIALSAFAILAGIALGLRFAKPIHDLAAVANRIRLGELDARAKVVREDELGLLARTFNQMAEELERQVTLLHEFEKYFEVSLDMLCIAGTDGYFKRVNPAFERILGWPSEELLTRPFIDFVHPDDVASTVHEIEKLAQGIPTVSFENRYRCADGTYKHLMWNSYPEPDTGLLYAIARDLTELKQAQDQVRAAGESAPSDPG